MRKLYIRHFMRKCSSSLIVRSEEVIHNFLIFTYNTEDLFHHYFDDNS